MCTPLVSIIIPTFKDRGHLALAVSSALSQSYKNIEVIVVDDNEPNTVDRDHTESVISTFKDHRLVYIKHAHNKNGAAARNTGLFASKGEFIAFLDDDDEFCHVKTERQYQYLCDHPDMDAVYCLARKNEKCIVTVPYEGDVTLPLLMSESKMFTPTLFFRKNPLLKIGGFDETFRRHQDYELLLRFFSSGFKIGCLQEVLTIIGGNKGENIPVGRKLEELKHRFLLQFDKQIELAEASEKGFKNRVYSKHYAGVFLSHMKHKYFGRAVVVFCRFFPKSPFVFLEVIFNSLKEHLSR